MAVMALNTELMVSLCENLPSFYQQVRKSCLSFIIQFVCHLMWKNKEAAVSHIKAIGSNNGIPLQGRFRTAHQNHQQG
jgi:hypothetical protein